MGSLTSHSMQEHSRLIRLVFVGVAMMLMGSVFGQRNVKDSLLFSPHMSFSFAQHVPGLDMAKRFGTNSAIGGSFHIKTKTNFYYGVEGTFLFGNNVTEPKLMQNLLTENQEIISNDGEISEVLIQQRGFTLTANAGKIISFGNLNPNSGILLKGGAGWMMHKIRLENQVHTITQLEDEYLKGYDRLTSGLVLSQFVGFYYMGNYRFTNFYVGAESYQGFTRGRRTINYDTRTTDDQPRTELLVGLRFGWVIHMYKRTGRDYYYN